jgi:hypothetical protein
MILSGTDGFRSASAGILFVLDYDYDYEKPEGKS